MKFILITIVLIVTSCKSQKALDVADKNQDDELSLLMQEDYFFTDSLETNVIRDEKALKSFFSRVNRTRKPGLSIPKVNFKEEMVLVVCAGKQSTGNMPYLSLIGRNEKDITIGIKMENKSKKGTTGVSYPLVVYKIPVSMAKVSFTRL